MNRAYSLLDVKSVEEESRTIRGIATTPTPDRMGDIVEPLGVSFATPLPLLWQHKHDKPVGHVWFDKPTKNGISFRAQLASIDEPGALKDRLDEAWQSLKTKLVSAVSIGFRALEIAFMQDGGMHFIKTEVLELSLVTVPANGDATITQIKSLATAQRIASGPRSVRLSQPGDAGAQRRQQQESSAMKTLAEQIASFEATRAAKTARQNEIMTKTIDAGRSTDAAEQEEFDTLQDEIKALDADLNRLTQLEANNKAAARPATAQQTRQTVSDIIQPQRAAIQLKQELPKGTAFTRYVMCLAASRGNLLEAAERAKRWKDSTPDVEMVLRAAVTAGTTTDADWAQPLVAYRQMADEFIELLRPATILGRIPGLRRVPFNIKIPVQTQGSLVNWVGEAKPKPVGELKFVMIQLDVNKVAGIVVLSEELVRLSTPSAEAIVRQDLVKQIAQFLDVEFIDPANAAVAGVSPASILNGVTGIPSTGGSAAEAKADLAALQAAFTTANLGTSGSVYVTTEIIVQQLAALQNPLGQPEFPTLQTGDTINRATIVASQSVPAGILAMILPSEILLADDGGVTIDASREATLTMDSAPADGAAATFSLWQNNCVGIRAERWITWRRQRDTAVAYITGANYDGVAVP